MLMTAGLSLDLTTRMIVSIQLAENGDADWIQLTLANTTTSLHVTRRGISEQLSFDDEKWNWFVSELAFVTTN
jgi:hypothetical protein